MKLFYLLLSVIIIGYISFGQSTTAHSAGVNPIVAEFNGSQAVKLEIGTKSGDTSWMSLVLDTPIDPSDYPNLTVAFNIYRSSDSNTNSEWLPWSFQGANFAPFYGGQYGDTTYPFIGSGGTTGSAPTVKDQYTYVELSWNFEAGTCSSWYNGNAIDSEFTLINPPADPAPVTGFTFNLSNLGVADGEVVWIDDFLLAAWEDNIHYYLFDGLSPGTLNGQGLAGSHWETGTNTVIPIPDAIWLLGSGLIGFAGIRRRYTP
ncbi:MAG: hypothetical protein C0403_19975 [Desulfobacterium sp.]|nr:hypothetical protein [Desulfobacterium sp.]